MSYDTTSTGYGYIKEWSKVYNLAGGKKLTIVTFVTDVLSESLDTSVKFIAGIHQLDPRGSLQFVIRGNPSDDGSFELIFNKPLERTSSLRITDLKGKVVYEGSLKKGVEHKTMHMPNMANGAYIVRIRSGDRAVSQKLLVY